MLIEIPEQKLRDYLLNPDHPNNGGKAAFFLAGGFQINDLETFRSALQLHLQSSSYVIWENGKFGTRLVIEDSLFVPDGRDPLVCSVWMVDNEGGRFVTAYPIDNRKAYDLGYNPFLTRAAIRERLERTLRLLEEAIRERSTF